MWLAKAHGCDDSSALLLMATKEGKSVTISLYKGDNFGELMTAGGYRLDKKSVDLVFLNTSRRSLEGSRMWKLVDIVSLRRCVHISKLEMEYVGFQGVRSALSTAR